MVLVVVSVVLAVVWGPVAVVASHYCYRYGETKENFGKLVGEPRGAPWVDPGELDAF